MNRVAQFWRASTQRFKALWKHLPLFGNLIYCSPRDHANVLGEIFITLVFSTATFWMTGLFLLGSSANRALGDYWDMVHSTMISGELFIFCVGFVGPILIITEWKKGDKEFPGRIWHILAMVLLCAIAAGYHSQIKSAQFQKNINQDDLVFLYPISVAFAISAIVLRYLSMVYKRAIFSPEDELKAPESDFAAEYEKHALEVDK